MKKHYAATGHGAPPGRAGGGINVKVHPYRKRLDQNEMMLTIPKKDKLKGCPVNSLINLVPQINKHGRRRHLAKAGGLGDAIRDEQRKSQTIGRE